MTAVERAFQMARTGNYENFTQVKRALRGEFHVERDLQGKQLHTDVTRICRQSRQSAAD